MISYKAELIRIQVIEVNESYTSKCSYVDLEPLKKHNRYFGARVIRGLFRGLTYLLNANVNGSLNVLRNVIDDDFIRDLVDRGCWFQPVRIRSLFQPLQIEKLSQPSYEQFLITLVNII
jgi:transposase